MVEKDRTGRLNGREFNFPSFKTFAPHFDSMEQHDSTALFVNDITDDGFQYEKRQREILCEERKGLFVKLGLDGNSAEAKAKRLDVMEEIFATRSWTAIESLPSQQLREGFSQIKNRATET